MPPTTRSRQPVTYSRKRTKARCAKKPETASSPLRNIEDLEEDITFSEMSHRMLKRARRLSNPEVVSSSSKKQKSSANGHSPSKYETPHPSVLTEAQKFKLNSSKGVPVHPDQFSPLPNAPRMISRTSSRNLKENASRRAPGKNKATLASPYNSRPGSAYSSPKHETMTPAINSSDQQQDNIRYPPKRTLSDTHFNANIPTHSASTSNSPAHSPTKTRRPSAPTPPRPGTWLFSHDVFPGPNSDFDFDFTAALANNPFFFPSSITEVNFNRPPSSLSTYGADSQSQFFDDVQGASTPFRRSFHPSTYPPSMDSDSDSDDGHQALPSFAPHQDRMDVDLTQSSPGMKPRYRERSPWLSDSLISPPASGEWKHPPQFGSGGAYIHPALEDTDLEMTTEQGGDSDDDITLGLGSVPRFGSGEAQDVGFLSPASTDQKHAGELKDLFDSLALSVSGSANSEPIPMRTRSLDAPANIHPPSTNAITAKAKGRDRRGTIRASDFGIGINHAPARRTRSGTVIGPPVQDATSTSKTKTEATANAEVEDLDEWCGDGWTVAAPPSPVVTRSKGKRGGKTKGKTERLRMIARPRTGIVEEEGDEEDELLLKPGFNIWEGE